MSRVVGFYTDKQKRIRPITERKRKSTFIGGVREPSWKKSSVEDIKRVDETPNEYRFRIRNPSRMSNFRATTFNGKLPKGVYVVRAKDEDGEWVTQSVRFKKDKFTYAEAKRWLREHKSLWDSKGKYSESTSRLAGHNGHIWVNPKVKGEDRRRLLRHEKVEKRLMDRGMNYEEAHRIALKEEHKGMTKREIARYEGRLGAIARWYPPNE